MADPTPTKAARASDPATNGGTPDGSAATSPELGPVMKLSRARATTSDAPRRVPRAAAASKAAPAPPAGTHEPSALEPATPKAIPEAPGGQRPANVSIYQGGADAVEADAVTITQGGATTVRARSVDVRQGGIMRAEADDIAVSMGGVALARADRVSVEMGGLGVSFAREAHLTQGAARSMFAQEIRVDQGLVGTAFAGRVTFERPSGVFLLVAGRVEGQVKSMLDWRGALALGAAFGVVAGLLRRR